MLNCLEISREMTVMEPVFSEIAALPPVNLSRPYSYMDIFLGSYY